MSMYSARVHRDQSGGAGAAAAPAPDIVVPAGPGETFDGRRMRKAVVRTTIDFLAPVLRRIEVRGARAARTLPWRRWGRQCTWAASCSPTIPTPCQENFDFAPAHTPPQHTGVHPTGLTPAQPSIPLSLYPTAPPPLPPGPRLATRLPPCHCAAAARVALHRRACSPLLTLITSTLCHTLARPPDRPAHSVSPILLANTTLQMPPAYALPHMPGNAVATRYMATSMNKFRFPVNCLKVRRSDAASRHVLGSPLTYQPPPPLHLDTQFVPEGKRVIMGNSNGELTLWNALTFNFETILQVRTRRGRAPTLFPLLLTRCPAHPQAHDGEAVRVMEWSRDGSWMITVGARLPLLTL